MKLFFVLLWFFLVTFVSAECAPKIGSVDSLPVTPATTIPELLVADPDGPIALSPALKYGGTRAAALAPDAALDVAIPATAQEFRLTLRIPVAIEESYSFLRVGGLNLGFKSDGADFGCVIVSEVGATNLATDVYYSLEPDGLTKRWLRLALSFHPSEQGGVDCSLFIEGTLIHQARLNTKPDVFTLSSSRLRSLQIGDLDFSDLPSDFVSRALSQNVAASSTTILKENSAREDQFELRSRQAGYPAIHETILPGELDLYQEAWHLTGTADREFWISPQLGTGRNAMKRYAETYEPSGTDFIPGLTTRGWNEPWAYTNHGDDYLERLRAYFVPEVSGHYCFWLSADERAALYISDPSDNSDATKRLVALKKASAYRTFADRRRQRSKAVHLEADQPYLLELLHYESTGLDHLDVAISVSGSERNGSLQLLPTRRISAYSAGLPGTFPRSFFPRAPELLPDSVPPRDPEIPFETNSGSAVGSEAEMVVASTTSSDGALVGGETIYQSDFTNDPDGWLYHPQLGWLWSDAANFASIYCDTWDQWLFYAGGANPQQFFNYDTEEWFKVFNLPGSWLIYNPVITTQPQSLSIFATETAEFSITLSHPEDPRFVIWAQDEGQVQAGGLLNLSLPSADMDDAGQYQAYVSNPAGSIFSDFATLNIQRLAHSLLHR
jgi:hypothetical protein